MYRRVCGSPEFIATHTGTGLREASGGLIARTVAEGRAYQPTNLAGALTKVQRQMSVEGSPGEPKYPAHSAGFDAQVT
jgi:hypothetical protein